MAKVIKLTDNSAVTLLPITDSAYVQHRWKEGATGGTTVTSVQDALNNVIDRVDGVHASGSDNQHLSGSGIALASANTSSVAYVNLDGNGGKVGIQGTAGTSAVNKIGQADVVVSYDTSGTNNIRIKVSYTDTNTHAGSHSINASQTSGGAAYINLSGTNCTGTVGIRGTGATTVTYTSNGDVVVNSTDEKIKAEKRTASTKYYLLGANDETNQKPKYDSNVYLDTTAGKFYAQLAYTTTPGDTDNSTRIPTTAWVKSRIGDLTGAMRYKGTIGSSDATVTSLPAKHDVGDVYIVKTNGKYAGTSCSVGDMIICNTAGSSANDAHWTVVPLNFTVESSPDVIVVPYTTAESSPFTIATVDGKDITTTVKHAAVTTNTTPVGEITPEHGAFFKVVSKVEVSNGHVTTLETQHVVLPKETQLSRTGTDKQVTLTHGGTFTYISNLNVSDHSITYDYTTATLPSQGPDYGQIKVVKHSALATDAISSSTADVTLSSVNDNELVTFESVNKWLHIKGTNGAAGSDKVQFSHALKGTGGTAALKKIAWDEAGHIGASADVTITKNLKYDVYPCAVEFTLPIGDAESTGNTIVTNIS